MELLSGLLSSLGLSGAAGLNAFIPLLVVGLLDRLGAEFIERTGIDSAA